MVLEIWQLFAKAFDDYVFHQDKQRLAILLAIYADRLEELRSPTIDVTDSFLKIVREPSRMFQVSDFYISATGKRIKLRAFYKYGFSTVSETPLLNEVTVSVYLGDNERVNCYYSGGDSGGASIGATQELLEADFV